MKKCAKHKSCLCIIDDDPEIADLYKNYINHRKEFYCFETFRSVTDFLLKISHFVVPDMLILDIGLPDIRGDHGIIEIKKFYPDIDIIIFSVHTDEEIILQSYLNGAAAFISKGEALPKMIEVLDIVANGGFPFNSHLARTLINILEDQPDKNTMINDHELDLLERISTGASETYLATILNQPHYQLTRQFKKIILECLTKNQIKSGI
ncbi:MAG: response regulator transcription factor [Calditrichia bacterium]